MSFYSLGTVWSLRRELWTLSFIFVPHVVCLYAYSHAFWMSHNLTQLICVSLCCDIVLDAVPKVVNMNHTILSLLNLSPSWEKSILISNAKTDVLLGAKKRNP